MSAISHIARRTVLGAMLLVTASHTTLAQNLPGPADPSRVQQDRFTTPEPERTFAPMPRATMPEAIAPEQAKDIRFVLRNVSTEGVTILSDETVKTVYEPYLNQEITGDIIWLIADGITKLYREQGYFLSRAYVPAQEIDSGVITIRVVEGYVGEILFDDNTTLPAMISDLRDDLQQKVPLRAADLENFLLRLNDLPGFSYRAIIEPMETRAEGAVRLNLRNTGEPTEGLISFNNYGSRYLGPYQIGTTWRASVMPLHETTLSLSAGLPTEELKYASLQHRYALAPDWTLGASASYVGTRPGDEISANDIRSRSTDIGIGFSYKPIRQWQKNLTLSADLSEKRTDGDILGDDPLTRDRLYILRGNVAYDTVDSWNAQNHMTAEISRGLDLPGASTAGDPYLSRAEADPEFTKIYITYMRRQYLGADFMLDGTMAGQWASGPLFSSQEFGYGGQYFGRAYDSSEIAGDKGIEAALKLSYLNLSPFAEVTFTPYSFYDIGKVWNEDTGSEPLSGTSAGLGINVTHDVGVGANLQIAWPLTRRIQNPLRGDGTDPVIRFGIEYKFQPSAPRL